MAAGSRSWPADCEGFPALGGNVIVCRAGTESNGLVERARHHERWFLSRNRPHLHLTAIDNLPPPRPYGPEEPDMDGKAADSC